MNQRKIKFILFWFGEWRNGVWLMCLLPPSLKRKHFFSNYGVIGYVFLAQPTQVKLLFLHSLINSILLLFKDNSSTKKMKWKQLFWVDGMEFFCVRWPPAHNQPLSSINLSFSFINSFPSAGIELIEEKGRERRRREEERSKPFISSTINRH